MGTVFEPAFWCQSYPVFHHLHDSPPPSPLYDPFMAGPTRTESSNHRLDPLAATHNPPRPPNAWILYRSDKLKNMPPPPPGMPRKPQADISKAISLMWKAEPVEVRSYYERLSDIRKAEHQARYPGYRFQPMKKADKDRLKAEKQAEKDRGRVTRKSKGKTRKEPPPLYTTAARHGPVAVSSPSSASSTPSVAQSTEFAAANPTPPPEYPTPPAVPPATPSLYPPPPSTTLPPPLVAPRPGLPQRVPSPSGWLQLSQPSEPDCIPQSVDPGPLPDLCGHAGTQRYLTVPLPSHPLQRPLGWSPEDPSPFPDLPFFAGGDPVHAVMSATDNPNVFHLGNFDDLFDGTRMLELAYDPNTIPSSFVDANQLAVLNDLFNMDTQALFPPPGAGASTSTSGGQSAAFDAQLVAGLGAFAFDSGALDEQRPFEAQGGVGPQDSAAGGLQASTAQDASASVGNAYAPPAGASNTEARRVGADWRHICLTPEPEPTWGGQGQ